MISDNVDIATAKHVSCVDYEAGKSGNVYKFTFTLVF